jgi:ATP-binding cassette, subfamily C, bacterial
VTTTHTTLRTLRRLAAALVRDAPRQTAAALLVTLGLSLTEGVGLLLLIPLLGLVGVQEQGSAMSAATAAFRRVFGAVGITPTLGIVLGVYVAVVGLQSILQRWQVSLTTAIPEGFAASLRSRLYRAIAGADWLFLARSRASDYAHVLTAEVSRVGVAAHYLIELTATLVVSIVYIGLALRLSPAMAALVLACGATLVWVLRGRIEDARVSGTQVSLSRGRLYSAIAEHLASMKTARSYGIADRYADIFTRLSDELRDVNLGMTADEMRLQQWLSIGLTVMLAVVVYVSYGVLAVPTAQLLVLLFIFARLMPRLANAYRRMQSLAAQLPAFEATADLEARCLAAAEPAGARRVEVDFRDSIRFDRLTFDYRGDGRTPALAGLDLLIRAGSTTAVVGPSGAGKSTLADVLIGLLPPTGGRLLVDGRPLEPDHRAAWREQIGYVAQETFLFHDTVRANLVWARPDAGDEELWQALRQAAADQFVAGLPQGLDTVVGDRGVLLAGGERQRLSLARALLREPRLLILDEATSSLDSENELRIQQAIDDLHHQTTIVVITHRLPTIRHADVIHVLDQGRLVESGSWDQLWARSGRFRELCRAQGLDAPPGPTAIEASARPQEVLEP